MVALYFLGFCTVVAFLANKRGRRWWVWFIIAITISPLISGLILLCTKDLSRELKEEENE